MRLTEGHWPARGNGEWVIGQKLHAHNPWLAPGTNFHFGRRNWNIVGIFADNDSARESEIWTDTEDLRVHYKNPDQGANSIHVVLKAGSGDAFQQALKKDGRLLLDAVTEADYYSAQAKVANQLRSLGLLVALALAIGAVFGGMNTMYTAVARRQREIGVLRAVGFTRRDILGSFVIESTILGIAGGVVGSILAILVAQVTGLNSRTMNVGVTYFSYHASSSAIFAGVIAAVTIGVVGGLLPAWRAAKIGVLESLRGV
jgi:ABC-type antimicrobial peptide transport system permease subunit